MRIKRNYTQKIYRKIKSSLAKHEQRKNLKSVKYTSMLNKYQKERQRIMYNLLIDEIGVNKFMELSSKSAQMANQTHPNPKLKANEHLWQEEDQ